MNDSIEKRANFNIIRYANCWEDADILIKALCIQKDKNYLSIASGGDNSLALLAKNPKFVLAIDLNPVQLACLELKIAAFKNLTYPNLLQFLGVHKTGNRKEFYSSFKSTLSSQVLQFWDQHLDWIEKGIIHVGKFENYFHLFRRWVLPLIHSKKTISELLLAKSQKERTEFYENRWNNFRWKLLFKLFFSKKIMGKWGRDPEFFKYVDSPVSERILSRARYALTTLPINSNPYLEYILKGNFEKSLPFYLREGNFEVIRKNLDRIVLFRGDLKEAFEAFPHILFDGFNLSDIFEYMSHELYAQEMTEILNRSNSGARIAFWNMLAYRKELPALEDRINFLNDEAKKLHDQDQAFFYQSFILGVAK